MPGPLDAGYIAFPNERDLRDEDTALQTHQFLVYALADGQRPQPVMWRDFDDPRVTSLMVQTRGFCVFPFLAWMRKSGRSLAKVEMAASGCSR